MNCKRAFAFLCFCPLLYACSFLPTASPVRQIKPEKFLITRYVFVGRGKEVLKLKHKTLTVVFEPGTIYAFLTDETRGLCVLNELNLYDYDNDGRTDAVYLNRNLFHKSSKYSSEMSLYSPPGYSDKDIMDILEMGDMILYKYNALFGETEGGYARYVADIHDIHSLYVEEYYRHAQFACSRGAEFPQIDLLKRFFPPA